MLRFGFLLLGSRCRLGRRPLGSQATSPPSIRPPAPSSARARATNLGRADVLHGGPRLQGPRCTAARAPTRIYSAAGGARGGGFAPGAGGCGAWLRLQVRRLQRGGRVSTRRPRGPRACVCALRPPACCHLRGRRRPASSLARGARARAVRSLLRGAASEMLRSYCSPRHNGGLVLGVASWSGDAECAAPQARRLPSRVSQDRWDFRVEPPEGCHMAPQVQHGPVGCLHVSARQQRQGTGMRVEIAPAVAEP